MALKVCYIISFDLETTGLRTLADRIVQLGACINKVTCQENNQFTAERLGTFEHMCRSAVPMQQKSIEVTGITQKQVDNADWTESQLMLKFQQFLDQECKDPDVPRGLVAWNGKGFDVPFMACAASRLEMGCQAYFRSLKLTFFMDALVVGRSCLDTTKLSRNKFGECMYKLGEVYKITFGKDLVNAHGGLADSQAVLDLIQQLPQTFYSAILAGIECKTSTSGIYNIMHCVNETLSKIKVETTSTKSILSQLARLKRKEPEAVVAPLDVLAPDVLTQLDAVDVLSQVDTVSTTCQ